jgi:hypothetical protein
MTSYYVRISEDLMAAAPQWPDGFRLVERLPDVADPHWQTWLAEDDGAAPELEGMNIDPTVELIAGKPVITGRTARPAVPRRFVRPVI